MKQQTKKTDWRKLTIIITTLAVILLLGSAVIVRRIYSQALQPRSNSQNIILIEIPSGSSVQEIGDILEEKQVIRESWAFEWYVRNSLYRDDLKAGTYAFRPSQGVVEIVGVLAQGEVATDLVTILPGQRIDQVESTLINSGFTPEDVRAALEPKQYRAHPALVDKPDGASLEGYLYPESFQKTAATEPKDIITASLDEMHARLTPALRKQITRQGLTIHEGVILASIVEREVSNLQDRPIVARVFLNRLKTGMKLESDATASYGAILAGVEPSLTFSSPYNTYENKGLPPGPISNADETALAAVARPAKSDYLFFVSGDDGKTYFSNTLEEHEKAVEAHCKRLCN